MSKSLERLLPALGWARGYRRDMFVSDALAALIVTINLFNLGRHLVRAQHYRDLRVSAFGEWSRAVA